MKNLLKRAIRRVARIIAEDVAAATSNEIAAKFEDHKQYNQTFLDNSMLLSGVQAALTVQRAEKLHTLGDAEFKVFSQWGEDGIIEWLVSRLPKIPTSFVEFGVETYLEANTRFLLCHRNWRGLVMDSSDENMAKLRSHPMHWQYDLTAITAMIDQGNINDLITDNGFAGELGILSIDIDGNDYWVWNAITAANPWIVIVEYNAVLGDLRPLTIPYTPSFNRREAHPSWLYWGASIGAMIRTAQNRGYTLVGTNRAGNNAFFVRNDLIPSIDGAIEDIRPRPSLYRESRASDGHLSYVAGAARGEEIGDAIVTDVGTGQTLPVKDAGALYSDHWKAILGFK